MTPPSLTRALHTKHTYGKAWPTASHAAGIVGGGGGGGVHSGADKFIEETEAVFALYPNFSFCAHGQI